MEPFSTPPFSQLSLFSINFWAKRRGATIHRGSSRNHNTTTILIALFDNTNNTLDWIHNKWINAADRTSPEHNRITVTSQSQKLTIHSDHQVASTSRAFAETQLCVHTFNPPQMCDKTSALLLRLLLVPLNATPSVPFLFQSSCVTRPKQTEPGE